MSDKHTAVSVRPLPWKYNSHVSIWTGEIIFGVYYTIYDEGSGYRVYRGQFLTQTGEDEIAFTQTQESAKREAQTDFDKAVLRVIEATNPTS